MKNCSTCKHFERLHPAGPPEEFGYCQNTKGKYHYHVLFERATCPQWESEVLEPIPGQLSFLEAP